jgi:hypothetical protein
MKKYKRKNLFTSGGDATPAATNSSGFDVSSVGNYVNAAAGTLTAAMQGY